MFALEINFLKDRQPEEDGGRPAGPDLGSLPLLAGILVAVVSVGGVGGYYFWLVQQRGSLENEKVKLEARLNPLRQQLAELEALKAEVKRLEDETNALAGVVNRVKPWSAIVQNITNLIPGSVQLAELKQVGANGLSFKGRAGGFDSINDFMLLMGRSPFLVGELLTPTGPQLVDARRGTTREEGEEALVSYEIKANLQNKPLSELLPELKRNGAVGLETRIQSLMQMGILKSKPADTATPTPDTEKPQEGDQS